MSQPCHLCSDKLFQSFIVISFCSDRFDIHHVVTLYCFCINFVILLVATDKAYINNTEVVINCYHKAISISLYIENYTVIGNEAGISIIFFNVV